MIGRLHFNRQAARLTVEQIEELRSLGRIEGDYIYLPLSTYWTFREKVLASRSNSVPPIPHSALRIPHSDAPPLPSTSVIARNATRAVIRNIGQVMAGQPLFVSPEEETRRLAICRAPCEHYRVTDGRCAKCGCHTARLLRKTKLAAEHCPVGKW